MGIHNTARTKSVCNATNKHNNQKFQPDVTSDILETDRSHGIPYIIHQVYKDENIPYDLGRYVKSVVDTNQSWKYYFWTDVASRKLVESRLPRLLPTWDRLTKGIFKGDIIRILALYEYGGVYLDLDVEVFRSFDKLTKTASCIIPPEPFEHNAFLYGREIIINNAIVFCRARHPFLKLVLDNVNNISESLNPVDITGPKFLTRMYDIYINKSCLHNQLDAPGTKGKDNAPFAVEMNNNVGYDDSLYVPNTQYFNDKIDNDVQYQKFRSICNTLDQLASLQQRACVEGLTRGFVRKPNNYTFTVHHWFHLWGNKPREHRTISIKELIPSAVIPV